MKTYSLYHVLLHNSALPYPCTAKDAATATKIVSRANPRGRVIGVSTIREALLETQAAQFGDNSPCVFLTTGRTAS